jgi:hypothetical protein
MKKNKSTITEITIDILIKHTYLSFDQNINSKNFINDKIFKVFNYY